MRVIAKCTLREFWQSSPQYADAQGPIERGMRKPRRRLGGTRSERTSNTTALTLKRCNMNVHPIRTEADYEAALAEVERLWGSTVGTDEGDRLDVLLVLVDNYEAKHHPIDPPDPVEAIKFRMEQMNLTRKDLEPLIGHRGRVADVLNRRRPLSLAMIRSLHHKLHIPLESLIANSETAANRRKPRKRQGGTRMGKRNARATSPRR